MSEIRHKKKATEISPDGIAAAAATLAIKSKYLQEHPNLNAAFWVFFDDLIDDQTRARQDLDEQKEREEKQREGIRLWELSKWRVSKLPARAYCVLRRAYSTGDLLKPVTELTDDELLFLRGLGHRTLADIRAVIPLPSPVTEQQLE